MRSWPNQRITLVFSWRDWRKHVMMGGVRLRLKPGSSASKYTALPLHQPCLVGISLSGRHNALSLWLNQVSTPETEATYSLTMVFSRWQSSWGAYIPSPAIAITFPHFTTYCHRHAGLRHTFTAESQCQVVSSSPLYSGGSEFKSRR